MASSRTGVTITLKSNDGEEFLVSEIVAMQSQTIRHMIEDDCAQTVIPLQNVNAKILAEVIQFCKHHVEAEDAAKKETTGKGTSSKMPEGELEEWEMKFVDVDQMTLFELMLAANYLNISKLLDATCRKVADMIKAKSPEEIRRTFNIENDFTPEEEEAIRRDYQWAFE